MAGNGPQFPAFQSYLAITRCSAQARYTAHPHENLLLGRAYLAAMKKRFYSAIRLENERMPLVTISVPDHRPVLWRKKVADLVNAAVIETLGFPEDDRYQLRSPLNRSSCRIATMTRLSCNSPCAPAAPPPPSRRSTDT